jgi:transcriptional antiterminator RfaH
MVDQRSHEAESWYAVHCQPHKERLVVSQLSDQLGLAVYLPEIKRRRHGRTTREPFFPRYLFVRADLCTPEAGRINCTPGVVRLVGASGEALPIAAAVIDAIRERVGALNQAGGMPHPFRPGDAVRLTSGPLAGLEAVFLGPMRPSERVRVLVEFLGRLRAAEVPAASVRRAGPEPSSPQRPPRRTRGGGRAIHSS